MSKMRYVEKKFKIAEDFLWNTREGLTTVDEKMGIMAIWEKFIFLYSFYYQIKPFMSDSVAVNPPYIGETGINENFKALLFDTNTGERLYELIYKDGGNLNSQDKNSSEELNCKEEMSTEQEPSQEPLPQVAFEGINFLVRYFYVVSVQTGCQFHITCLPHFREWDTASLCFFQWLSAWRFFISVHSLEW